MSGQSGGTGYNKIKKSCQSGGASGWAKHCGDTKDHKLSNRTERRLAKEELVVDDAPASVPPRSKRKKVPTRKHLLDKLDHLARQVLDWEKREKAHFAFHEKKGETCHCWTYRANKKRDLPSVRYREEIAELLKEFDKHGYARP